MRFNIWSLRGIIQCLVVTFQELFNMCQLKFIDEHKLILQTSVSHLTDTPKYAIISLAGN